MNENQSIRRNLLDMLEALDHSLQPEDGIPAPKAIDANATLDLSDAARAEVEKIKQTIQRIQRGEVGVCLLCGQAIAPERLARLPFAHYCAQCAHGRD
jgi:DnaK suppressor protein